MNPLYCILPPHILEALAAAGDEPLSTWAQRSLEADAAIRTERAAVALGLRSVAAPVPTRLPHRQRSLYDAGSGSTLPGRAVRSEGQAPTGDQAVDEAYDALGATFDLYWDVYDRDSIDDAGMELVGSVHYLSNYDNAFWNGTQMVFGDGDGTYFNRFTAAVDVVGHELTHGVTAHEANLTYRDQPGALNESVSDVFGSIVKQFSHSPPQTAAEADWLIGAGLFTARVNGVALRSMKDPGTAYDDPVLGKDPQPADMSGYVTTTDDNGGVHINSGIPNRAFYLAAVALGGHAWERAGAIWYATLGDARLSPDAEFKDFASLTTDNAGRLYDDAAREAVATAWHDVGVETSVAALERGAS